MARTPQVVDNIAALRRLEADTPGAAGTGPDARLTLESVIEGENPALDAWRRSAAPPPATM